MGDNNIDLNKIKIIIGGKVYDEDWVFIETPHGYYPIGKFVMDATNISDIIS